MMSNTALGTILPFGGVHPDAGLEYADTVVELLREVKSYSGISRFVLGGPCHSVRISGALPVERYHDLGKIVRRAQELARDDGIEIGFRMGPTINVGINHPWQIFTYGHGGQRLFTACPGDPDFQAAFAEQCAAVASECHPFIYMMEDDFRYFGSGCFCENHLKRFSGLTGHNWSREELADALKNPEAMELRAQWTSFQAADLVTLAKGAEKAIHEVSPDTRIALSAPGMQDEQVTAAIARALAGPNHPPFVRWWGAIYGTDYPLDMTDILFHARWAKENVSDGIECVYEADPCPRSAFFASGARLSGMCSTAYAFGFDGLWYWGLDHEGIAKTPQYLDEHSRLSRRFDAIRTCAQGGHLSGISVALNLKARPAMECGAGSYDRPMDECAAARLLNRLGIPFTTRPGKATFYATSWAFEGLDDIAVRKILSGNVILDGAAAEELTKRGFASLIGVEAVPRDKIDFTDEMTTSDQVHIMSAFHSNYGLDGCPVSRLKSCGAEEASFYYDTVPEHHVQPSVTRYVNSLGGRISVMAVHLAGSKSINLYNQGKRDLLVSIIRWLGGDDTVPIRIVRNANIMIVANEDEAKTRLFVHALSMNCDVQDTLSFEVNEQYRGGDVEVLDDAAWTKANADWQGNILTLKAGLHVYRTLVFRITR